ncbi:MAG: DUF4115 domain-containing protein [Actinobacteria bacterium]|nr:DUF4115 domain-containing protein [Actinomycetota bacterium]
MFEIGNSLREARQRQGVDFTQAEQATKIRGKYLRALEEERFELLPAQTYVKGFLRSYAEYLGLDGQLYVDEYNSRYVTGEDEAPLRTRRSSAPPPRRPRETRGVLLALSAIAIVTALVIAAWNFGAPPDQSDDLLDNRAPGAVSKKRPKASVSKRARPNRSRTAAPRNAKLLLRAAYGSTWVQVHAGSPSGPQLFAGTLEEGRTMGFEKRRLWLRIGRPGTLIVKLNGKRRALPREAGPLDVTVTPRSIRPASA